LLKSYFLIVNESYEGNITWGNILAADLEIVCEFHIPHCMLSTRVCWVAFMHRALCLKDTKMYKLQFLLHRGISSKDVIV
jgi:hypothetical protein